MLYDKFDTKNNDLDSIVKSNSFTMTEAWILSKLQSLVKTVTLSLDSCRLNEGERNWKIYN